MARGEALVATYADTDLFAGAVSGHLAQRADAAAQLEAELTGVRSTVTEKQRLMAQ